MPKNENQHYVPKCHLRPFSPSSSRRNIALYNAERDIFVASASIADQCQRSYFYGRDLELEMWFQKLEGAYATAVRSLENGCSHSPDTEAAIRAFMHYHDHRTPTAVAARQAFHRGMFDAATRGLPEKMHPDLGDLSDLNMLHDCIETESNTLQDVADLQSVIVENRSHREFATSDHPTIMTNRLQLQRLKAGFGFASAGTIFALPPNLFLLALCYDTGCYTVEVGRSGRHVTTRPGDIDAFNMLQFLQFQTNVYYRDPRQNEAVRSGILAARNSRVPGPAFWVGVEDAKTDSHTRYRVLQDDDKDPSIPRLIHGTPKFPLPTIWFKGLRLRAKPVGYGLRGRHIYVREAHRKRNGRLLERCEL